MIYYIVRYNLYLLVFLEKYDFSPKPGKKTKFHFCHFFQKWFFLTIYIKFRWKKIILAGCQGGGDTSDPLVSHISLIWGKRYSWNLLVHDEKLLLLDSCHDLDISSLLPSDAEFLSCPSFWFLNNLFKIRLSSTNYCQELNKSWVFFNSCVHYFSIKDTIRVFKFRPNSVLFF